MSSSEGEIRPATTAEDVVSDDAFDEAMDTVLDENADVLRTLTT